MSKKSHRSRNDRPKGRRARRAGSAGVRGDDGGLRLVVATGAEDGDVSLERGLQLVRAGLLYADTVEFVSPIAHMLAGVAEVGSGNLSALADLIVHLDDETRRLVLGDLDLDEALEGLEVMRQAKALSREQRRKYMPPEMQIELDQRHAGMVADLAPLQELAANAGFPELVDAIESGALSLNLDLMSPDVDEMMDRYVELLAQRLESPGVHLLLDDQMADIARSLIEEGRATPSAQALSRSVRTRAGTGLISHLPAFPNAKVADILEARIELYDSLTSYRTGMKAVENSLSGTAFDPELPSEIDEMWRDEVEPTIRNLRRDLSKTRIAHAAGLNVLERGKWTAIGISTVAFGIAPALDLGAAATGITGAGYAISETVTALKQTQAKREAARSHDLFYLLQVQDQLGS